MVINRDIHEWTGVQRQSFWAAATPPDPIVTPACAETTPVATSWFKYCIPAQRQEGNSCVGQGWANWLELMVRRYVSMDAIPKGKQIDGQKIYDTVCEMFWPSKHRGGTFVHQGFYALLSLGWIPENATVSLVNISDENQVAATLQATPIVTGHEITEAWFDPRHENGFFEPRIGVLTTKGGHCTITVGWLRQGEDVFLPILNSWGKSWGYYGLGLMHRDSWMRGQAGFGAAVTADLPTLFQGFEGWKGGLCNA